MGVINNAVYIESPSITTDMMTANIYQHVGINNGGISMDPVVERKQLDYIEAKQKAIGNIISSNSSINIINPNQSQVYMNCINGNIGIICNTR